MVKQGYKMNFKCIQLILMMFISSSVGELLMISSANINMSRILKNISRITITACYMECAKEIGCHSIAVTEEADNQLPICHLLKEDNGHYEGRNVMTTIQAIGSKARVNGLWGAWKNITVCDAFCEGGTLKQSRDCDSPKPEHGGDNFTGASERTIKCNEQACPVNGSWGAWKNITVCDAFCEGGTLKQSRDCDSPKPEHGGDNFTGASERTIKCNEQACPVLNCGSDSTAPKGYMKSPNYPNSDYLNNDICRGTISGSGNAYIRITILFMDIEKETVCNYDYLAFETTNQHKRYCGQEEWSDIFRGPLTITFKTDADVVRRGFYLKWERFVYGK